MNSSPKLSAELCESCEETSEDSDDRNLPLHEQQIWSYWISQPGKPKTPGPSWMIFVLTLMWITNTTVKCTQQIFLGITKTNCLANQPTNQATAQQPNKSISLLMPSIALKYPLPLLSQNSKQVAPMIKLTILNFRFNCLILNRLSLV